MLHASWKKVINGFAMTFVVSRADEARWLVQNNALDAERLDPLPVGANLIVWLHPIARLDSALPIDDDIASQNHGITGSA